MISKRYIVALDILFVQKTYFDWKHGLPFIAATVEDQTLERMKERTAVIVTLYLFIYLFSNTANLTGKIFWQMTFRRNKWQYQRNNDTSGNIV